MTCTLDVLKREYFVLEEDTCARLIVYTLESIMCRELGFPSQWFWLSC